MPLSPEAREIVREATLEALTRRLTPEEVYDEIVRLVTEADDEPKALAVGQLFGRIASLSQTLVAAADASTSSPESDPDPEPDPDELVS